MEWAWQVSPENGDVRAARRDIYGARAVESTSLMATNIYRAAAEESNGGQ